MITLTERLDDYIAVRRSLGYDLSFAARVLRGFTRFADREGIDHITVDLFLRWKKGFGKADNKYVVGAAWNGACVRRLAGGTRCAH